MCSLLRNEVLKVGLVTSNEPWNLVLVIGYCSNLWGQDRLNKGGGLINRFLMNWAAETFIERLRSGQLEDSVVLADGNWPFWDYVRKNVQSNDKSLAFQLLGVCPKIATL